MEMGVRVAEGREGRREGTQQLVSPPPTSLSSAAFDLARGCDGVTPCSYVHIPSPARTHTPRLAHANTVAATHRG